MRRKKLLSLGAVSALFLLLEGGGCGPTGGDSRAWGALAVARGAAPEACRRPGVVVDLADAVGEVAPRRWLPGAGAAVPSGMVVAEAPAEEVRQAASAVPAHGPVAQAAPLERERVA